MSLQIPGAPLLDPNLPCALCGSHNKRQLSHIIPSFVFKHASVRSPTGFLRTNLTPNRRVQDGPKDYILCSPCEQMFGVWEQTFSKTYKQYYVNRSTPFNYKKADAMCALSIVWRVLYNARAHPELNHLTFGDDYSRTDSAFQTWSQALLSGSNPGKFRLYWLFFDTIAGGTQIPEGINRYIFHATDFDLMANSQESFVYVHIPGLFIFGMTEPHDSSEWRDLRVAFNGGRQSHRNRSVPGQIGLLINQKVSTSNASKASMSQQQQEKIRKQVLKNPEALWNSPLAAATIADMSLEKD
jgi:hypothetical protein